MPTNLSDTLHEVDISDHKCAANYNDPLLENGPKVLANVIGLVLD